MAKCPLYREDKYDERPDPEELLSRYHLHDLTPEADDAFGSLPTGTGETYQRGRLRVYLAAAAGAGQSTPAHQTANCFNEQGSGRWITTCLPSSPASGAFKPAEKLICFAQTSSCAAALCS